LNLDPVLQAILRQRPKSPRIAEWSLYISRTERMTLGVKDRQAGNAHSPLKITDGCGARYLLVWEDGRISRGYLERKQLEREATDALAAARAAAYRDPDAAHVLGPAEFPDVELYDEDTASQARGSTSLIARRLATIRKKIASHSFGTWSGAFSISCSESRVVTSAGLEAADRKTSFSWRATVEGECGDGFSGRRPEGEAEFEQRLDRVMETIQLLKRQAEPMTSGTYPVLLHPEVVEDYVLNTLLWNLSGPSVSHGDGRFRVDQFGADRRIVRQDLALRIDPLQPMKSGSYRFTTEGLPASRCSYIERGRLVRPVLNLKYAHRLGLPLTPVPYAMDVLSLEGPPPLSLAESLEAASRGALVLSVLGVHAQDKASGDFSLSAPQALRIEGGRLRGRIRATISGNLFDLLASDELNLVRFPGEHTPGLLVSCRLDPASGP
jgi:PmbA protein